ncbi:MAG: hypothetical protein IT168_32600 [Bryobacterales bacterium]|nr:hypothetical protein [Bryobacterales bacterium]
MILLLLIWLWLLVAGVVTGASLIGREETDEPFAFAAVLGLLVLPAPLLAISLWTPLAFWHFAAVYVALPAIAYACRRPALPRPAWIPLLLALAGCAWNSSGPVMLFDTGLYHYPLAEWLERFGTVPGQALFHYRFGFSSPWIAAPAALDHGWMDGRSAAVFNGLLMAVAVYHFACALSRWAAGEARRTDSYFLAGYSVCLFFAGFAQRFEVSMSPNLAVAIAIVLMCAAPPRTAWLLAAAASGIKLSALPVAALSALRLRPRDALAVLFGGLLLAPIVAANYVSSGCPLYPSELLCTESSTSVGRAFAYLQHLEVRNWARWEGPNLADPQLLRVDWVGAWLRRHLNLPITLTWVVAIAVIVARRIWTFGFVLAALGLAYVLVAAPDYRFGIGYVAALCGLAAGGVAWPGRRYVLPVTAIAAIAMVLFIAKATVYEEAYRRMFKLNFQSLSWDRVAAPAPIQLYHAELAPRQSHDVPYYVPPPGGQCWGAVQPCTPYAPDIRLCDAAKGVRGGICRALR